MKSWTPCLLLLLTSAVAFGQTAASPPFDFKGNFLGMDLEAFKTTNNQETVWINTGDPNKRQDKKKTMEVPTPFCTDTMHEFPGDDGGLEPGEVLCNPAPAPVNHRYRTFAGIEALQILYRFYRGKLYSINITIPTGDYQVVRSAFIQKYGSNFTAHSQGFENAFGASWSGEILSWQRNNQFLVMAEGSGNGPGQNAFNGVNVSSIGFTDTSLAPPIPKKPATDF